jgi:hypothetical protein
MSKLGEFFRKNLQSVLETNYPNFEVLLVDNGSEDHSLSYVKETFGQSDKLKVVCLGKNYGYCEGNNKGVEQSSSDSKYLVFLNNDTIVERTWLTNLIAILEKNSDIGIAGSLLLNMDGTIQSLGGNVDIFGRSMLVGDERARPLVEKGQPIKVLWTQGASLAIRKRLFLENGCFDPSFFMYYDEVDLCARLVSRGLKVVTVPRSIVYHKGGTGSSAVVFYYLYRNRTLFMLKSFPAGLFLRCLLIRSVLDPLNALLSGLAEKSFCRFCAIIKTYIYVLKNLTNIAKKRRTSSYKIPAQFMVKTPYFLPQRNYSLYALSKLLEMNSTT